MIPQANNNGTNIVLNWSSGKDAALAFHLLQQDSKYTINRILTTINDEQDRIVMHGVRESLLDAQADRMDVKLKKVKLPPSPSHDVYNTVMKSTLNHFLHEGINTAAFGDIFLNDLKTYREEQLAKAGFKGVFPLWEKDTTELIQMIEQVGIFAKVVCVNEKVLDKSFLGRKVDTDFITDLPKGVDPCGENGEFHTFVYNAPFFKEPINIIEAEVVHKHYKNENGDWDEGFYFMDIYERE